MFQHIFTEEEPEWPTKKAPADSFTLSESTNNRKHLARHTKSKPQVLKTKTSTSKYKTWECYICKKEFTRKSDFNVHLLTHGSFICVFCNKVFGDSTDLKHHVEAHLEEDNKCKICNKKFIRPLHLKKHIEMVHEGNSIA